MKYKALFSAFVFVFLIGCSYDSGNTVNPNLRSISFTAEISYYNENYTADFTVEKSGDLSARIVSPDTLKGLVVEYHGNNSAIKYNEIIIDNAQSYLPQTFSISLIKNVIKDCEKAQASQSDKKIIIKGNYKGEKYYMTLAPTGLPLELDLPDYALKVAFKNISLLNNKTEED